MNCEPDVEHELWAMKLYILKSPWTGAKGEMGRGLEKVLRVTATRGEKCQESSKEVSGKQVRWLSVSYSFAGGEQRGGESSQRGPGEFPVRCRDHMNSSSHGREAGRWNEERSRAWTVTVKLLRRPPNKDEYC